MRRFYSPNITGDIVTLDADETRHLRDVLRLRAGDEISVFDGKGTEFAARVESTQKGGAVIAIIKQIQPSAPESPLNITLACTVIPGDKYDLIVQKAVELGVVTFVPLASIRSEVKVKDLPKKLIRWRRIALDAAKQCGRATLMTVADPFVVTEFLTRDHSGERIFFSEREGDAMPTLDDPTELTVVIGPKGGWDDSEIETAKQNRFSVVTLGGRIMRAETAAIALTAIMQHRFGDIN